MKTTVKIIVVVTFVAMVVVNALSAILPINGIDPGGVSDFYENLFAPSGITFAIWGLIYLLLAAFTFYQLGIINKKDNISINLLNKIGIVFSISSILNIIWIFTWHYKVIYLSMILMVLLLVCLIIIVNALKKETLSTKEKFFVKLPFSIYFGWITVATIANATTLLVSLGWKGFGVSESVWAIIIIAIGAAIGVATILRNKDYAYGLVIIWAYIGILIKHTSTSGFGSEHLGVIITVIVSLVLIAVTDVYTLIRKSLNR